MGTADRGDWVHKDPVQSLSETILIKTGAHWQYWFALGFTIGFTFVGML